MRWIGLAAVLAAATLAAAAGAGPTATPGVTATQILIGGTVPLSGPETAYAPIARGAEAYFNYVNDHGGVNGRKIKYEYLDDGYDPARTVQATRQLVQQDGVFAIFNTVGTEHSLAIRPFLNQLKVPELFVGSGADEFARESKQYPWSMGYLPSFTGEGATYGRYIAKNQPTAKIAVLYENSAFGKELLAGLRKGLGAKAKQVVATQGYEVTDSDVSSQIASLKGSGANTFVVFALPKQTIQAFVTSSKLGWHPQYYVVSVSIDPFVMEVVRLSAGQTTTEGALSMAFLKDPTNPKSAGDAGVKLYGQIMRKYIPDAKPREVAHLYGMAAAFTMTDALLKAGKNPTRDSLLRAATNLNETRNPFLRKGVIVKTGPGDYYPISAGQLLRYHGTGWQPFGKVVPVTG
jgi:branched-chain amino acid transport system substrate-binding protein